MFDKVYSIKSISAVTNYNSSSCLPKWLFLLKNDFQSRDLEDWETQEATMSVCMYVCLSQKIIRFKSMNSSVISFQEWKKAIRYSWKWLKT